MSEKPEKYAVDRTPLLVGYMGMRNDMFEHIPPCGPSMAVGLVQSTDAKGKFIEMVIPRGFENGGKYKFQNGFPTAIYNPEHKAWYNKEIDVPGGSWCEMAKLDGNWVSKRGAKAVRLAPCSMYDACPDCNLPRASFGPEGDTGDEEFTAHRKSHLEKPVSPAKLKAAEKEVTKVLESKDKTVDDLLHELEEKEDETRAKKEVVAAIKGKKTGGSRRR